MSDDTNEAFDFSAEEARVLGVLIEKSYTTPDQYPLSLNALTNGCNQLTGREPVMSLDEATVADAVDSLHARGLVGRREGARVVKYEHLVRLRHSLPPPRALKIASRNGLDHQFLCLLLASFFCPA